MKPEEEIKKIVHRVEESAGKVVETTIGVVKKVESTFVKWLKRLGKVNVAILLLLLTILLLLQPSVIQTYLARHVTDYLTEMTGFESSVEKVSIRWLDEAVLKNVLIKDHKKNTMIAVGELVINYSLLDFLERKDIILDQVGVIEGKVNLINNAKDSTLNIQAWIDAFGAGIDPDTTLSTFKFIIREAYLQDTHFSYQDIYSDSLEKNQFDYFHFQLDSINGEIEHFAILNDTIEVQINTLSAIDPAINFPIRELRTFFRLCGKSMNFQKLYANIGHSVIKDSLVFRYNDMGDFSDFNNKVRIHAKLKDSRITYADLAFFAPSLGQWKETLKVSGIISGKVADFKAKKLDLRFGKNSHIKGDISMEGLPNIDETFIDYDLNNSQVFLPDIRQYLATDQYNSIEKFGLVKFSSELQGFYYDFVAHGNFNTSLGYIATDNIHLNLGEKINTYEGNLSTKNFDLGELLFIPNVLQKIDFKGFIKGKGFTPSTAEVDIDSQIARFGLYGYDYQNINLDAKLSKSLFEGKISVKDSNFIFHGEGNISLKDSTIVFEGQVEKSLLHKMNFAKKPTFLRANMIINLKGLDLDRLEGTANINHFDLKVEDRKLDMDYFILVDKVISNNKRRVALGSSLVNFTAEGDFSVGETVNHVSQLIEEYLLHFERNTLQINQYYAKKLGNIGETSSKNKKTKPKISNINMGLPTPKPANFTYEFWLKNINPIFDFFQIDAKINQNIKINGDFLHGSRSGITLKTKIDSIFYNKMEFYYSELDVNTSKKQDSTGVEGNIKITSKHQFILNEKNELITDTDNLRLDAQLADFVLKYDAFLHQNETTNSINTKGSLTFLPNQTYLLGIDSSKIYLANELWQNPEGSKVMIQGKEVNLQNITFTNGEDFVSAVGSISEDERKELTVSIKNLELDVFSAFLGFKLGGELNGFAKLQGLYDQSKLRIENELKIDSISIDNFLIGNILSTSTWDTPNKAMIINTDIERDGNKTLLCKGTFTPDNIKSPLNLKVQLNELEVNILEPFLADIASGFGGTATGELKITGKLASPVVEGSAFLKRGKFTINYLGTTYTFSDRVYLEKDKISFKRFRMRDDQRNLAFLDGSIFHKGFQNFSLNLKGRFSKFKLLDTKATDEALYYGTAIGTGTLSIAGIGANLTIDVDVKSEPGTKMYLAFDGYSTVEQKDFISYVEFSPKRYKDSTELKLRLIHPKIDLSRLLINMNVEITPDAFVEIILDRKTGDIIRGNARGKLSIKVDTKADFEMFGSVEIVQGAYNFTFQNLFNKEFGVAAGSTITWRGDPLKGIMNIKATYTQRASFAPLLALETTADNDSPELKRRYPIQVDLLLKGELLSPEIKFDINFYDYPNTIVAGGQSISLSNRVAAFKTDLANDEAELNRQVFSLILLRKLSPPNSFTGLGQSAAGSVSELLTNQLSYWMSQVDENLEVDIDLNGLDANALNTFQLRLSYSFLNGRVRVTRDGSFTNMQNQANTSSVIGDWTIEYLITPDGKLRMKMYRRNFSNVFDASLGNTSATTGVSIMYIKSFNKLGDFFGNIFKKKKNKNKKLTEKKKSTENPKKEESKPQE